MYRDGRVMKDEQSQMNCAYHTQVLYSSSFASIRGSMPLTLTGEPRMDANEVKGGEI